MKLVYVGKNKLMHGALLIWTINNLNSNKLSNHDISIPIFNNINDFINNGDSLSDIDAIIYTYDVLSDDSITFIRSITNIKKFDLKLVVILNQCLSDIYIKSLYDFGVDYVITPNIEINDLDSIFNYISNKNYIDHIGNKDAVFSTNESELNHDLIIKKWSKSARKKILLKAIASGFNNDEIADMSKLSVGTVRNYISQLTTLLGCENRTKLAFLLKSKLN